MTSEHMRRALSLAESVRGTTAPNPPVGSVVARHGQVVGEGSTRPEGGEHAEVIALRNAGDEAEGAALYVSLEPCAHWGRNPPCVDAIIAAGIDEVHVALIDPNPLVNGQGLRRLQDAGIDVTVGDGGPEAAEIIDEHLRLHGGIL